jgi:hypothetical protein
MSLWKCKSAHDKGKELLIKKQNTACDIQNLLLKYFSVEHYKMPCLLSIGQIIGTRTWKTPILLSYIKPMLLQNGPHHNLSTRWFDKNEFQIFLHNI